MTQLLPYLTDKAAPEPRPFFHEHVYKLCDLEYDNDKQ